MSTEAVFKEISGKMLEGLMFHDQMASYFRFIGLDGYSRLHEYRYKEESETYRRINDYFISHCDKLIEEPEISNPELIPSTWYQSRRQDVEASERRTAVKEAFDKWIAWETSVKALYERSCDSLRKSMAVAPAIALEAILSGVDGELSEAEQMSLELEAAGYDPLFIIEEQEPVKTHYEKKLRKEGVVID